MKTPLQIISDMAREGLEAREKFFSQNAALLDKAAFACALCMASGGKLLICGNGGSAADSQHLAAEFINRFLVDRPALPAIALTTDTSAITAIGNDSSFESIFSRQINALGKKGDMLLAISTSGNSPNIIAAIHAALENNMNVVGFTGLHGEKMAALCHWLLSVPSTKTPIIQEVHLACEHLFCHLCDYYLFENPGKIAQTLHPGD